jgi:hypothetical protein
METTPCVTPCVTLPLLKSIQEFLDPVKKNEEINKKIKELGNLIGRNSATLSKPPTELLGFREHQEVTYNELELAELLVKFAREKVKIQEDQKKYDDLCEAYELSSLEITKIRDQFASNFGVSGVLLDLLMELVSAGLIKQDLVFKKEIKKFHDIKIIDNLKKELVIVQERLNKNQVDLEEIRVMERDPKIDYKSYKFWLIDCEREENSCLREISYLESKIKSAEFKYEDDMIDHDSEIKEADSDFQVHIANVKGLCSLD